MKIVTVNVPESYIDAIEKLTGDGGLYPSRSELIRCAVREFLLKELRLAKSMAKFKEKPSMEELKEIKMDEENFVRIPVDKRDENNEPIRSFKTYKIVRRLEH
ncbi:MAG: ribbon-helix-helix protein, CopG family [Promethearchaeota archaeon]|nr:MAG: ribbon-helix-helix protein, CopG family [Candidatus Lokiarchaeota archaeon]